ncbi:WXG100 family type VII secretion target [Rhodococcus sp. TAF43]|uniref:WXG100 family type VII secretion target n=1 Tax=unclassified Rhodococcus (in: high G+C Gram-positive bacteria) TaxID=192944 RepID=UPI000E0C1DBB|nr:MULTISPECIES: WXG100 family type VII secretion target [unclassified Rhodococcus (in: high G+C Gram-positive bacteria)]QKT12739.1 WXG100 family type VII secretion target [Rhodococcus sp. W8901]RDI34006.1 early secretory antigenic target protein ESAT-6 [Rhodococcus sp. AG1013]
MSTPIHYSFGEIEALQQRIDGLQSEMNGKLEDLKKAVAQMVVDWDASSSDAYQEHQAKWDGAALELNQVLDAVGRVVGQGNSDMRDVNNAAAKSWA